MPRSVAMVILVVAVVLTGCGSSGRGAVTVHVEPNVNFTLPPASAGCGGATQLADGATRLPITVSEKAGQVAEMVNV